MNDSLVDSEESTANADLFSDITLRVTIDNITDVDTDMDTDPDSAEEARLDSVLLDDCPEDEDWRNKAPEVMAIDADEIEADMDKMEVDTDEVDADENKGIEMPKPLLGPCATAVPFQAGCVWTRRDWSCAYDAVFMSFFATYWHSSPSWHDNWKQQSPEWTIRLADHFDLLLEASNSPEYSPEQLSKLFSSFRDQFRSQLSNHDPRRFPRSGRVPTSVCAILELLFGSAHGPGIEQYLLCTDCSMATETSHSFSLLALLVFHRTYRCSTDPQFVPSETLLARFIESLSNPSKLSPCRTCHGATQVQSLTMATPPWIWFETNANDTMSPSPTLVFKLPGQRPIYDLISVIYCGENHFTTRIRDLSNEWWSYDGMWRFGAAQRDRIEITTDLLHSGRRYAAFLIYRRIDC